MKKILNDTYIDIEAYEKKCLELEKIKQQCNDFIEPFRCHSDCKWFGKRHQKCNCCRRNLCTNDNYETEEDYE